jgi:predicted dithiol-disulfide oxidoreductase (DUF899 family)
MTSHKSGTREEWLAVRLELLQAEKELTRRTDVARQRQELPWVRIDKDYRFDTDEGPASRHERDERVAQLARGPVLSDVRGCADGPELAPHVGRVQGGA